MLFISDHTNLKCYNLRNVIWSVYNTVYSQYDVNSWNSNGLNRATINIYYLLLGNENHAAFGPNA